MFFSGGLVVFPMLIIQNEMNHYFTGVFSQSFFVSGLSEEFIKWFIVYFLIYHHPEFDEHFDGIVYAVAAAAGYATVENVLYVFFQPGNYISMLWNRAFLPVSAHALFGVTMGYYFGLAKKTTRPLFLLFSLLLPVLFHGMFNRILSGSHWFATIFIFCFMGFLWLFNIKKMNAALKA